MEHLDIIKEILSYVAEVISIIGVLILIFSFFKILINYIRSEFEPKSRKTPFKPILYVRAELGVKILLTLDFLIASDIIRTVTDLDLNQLVQLGVLVVIRTVIGFFMGKEVEEVRIIHNAEDDA